MNSETKGWVILTICVTIMTLAIGYFMNRTNWIALQNGYCQTAGIGSGQYMWVKCNKENK